VVTERQLARARSGDEDAFAELTEPYRHELQFHCYRMLGSLEDAEDMLQEALLAAWRGLGRFEGAPRCARGSTGLRPTAA
jgi:RNA polymerase sigma-70 factor (ECF subfamily)